MLLEDTHWHIFVCFVSRNGKRSDLYPIIDTRHSTRRAAKQYKKRNIKHDHPDFVEYVVLECKEPDVCEIGV